MGGSYIPAAVMQIRVAATLTGAAVFVGAGPSDHDPLAQRGKAEHFGSLDHALEAVPRMVREHINALADEAANKQGGE